VHPTKGQDKLYHTDNLLHCSELYRDRPISGSASATTIACLLTLFSVKLVNVTFPLGLTTLLLLFPLLCEALSPLFSCSGCDTVFAVAVVAAAMVPRIVYRASVMIWYVKL
jgi:hypothetical protein